MASFSPKVIGSAWTPCVRPICTVCRNSSARRFENIAQFLQAVQQDRGGLLQSAAPARYPRRRWRSGRSAASAMLRAWPACRHGFGDRGGERDHIVLDFLSISWMRATSNPACARSRRAASGGHHAQFGQSFRGGQFDFEPLLEPVLVAPDPAHLGAGVAGNHELPLWREKAPGQANGGGRTRARPDAVRAHVAASTNSRRARSWTSEGLSNSPVSDSPGSRRFRLPALRAQPFRTSPRTRDRRSLRM